MRLIAQYDVWVHYTRLCALSYDTKRGDDKLVGGLVILNNGCGNMDSVLREQDTRDYMG